MAGFLNSKTRVMDSVVTKQGRNQIADGKMRIQYASITDAAVYYTKSIVSGSENVSNRLYLEATGDKRQDFITFETDDSGNLLGWPTNSKISLVGNDIFKKDAKSESKDKEEFVFVSSSNDFASLSAGIVTSSIDHFKQLYMVGSLEDNDSLHREFLLSSTSESFLILNTFPFIDGPSDSVGDVDALDPVFFDERLSHFPNFKFLPPIQFDPQRDTFSYPRTLMRERGKKRRLKREGREDEFERLFFGTYIPFSRYRDELTYKEIMIKLNGEGSDGKDPDYIEDVQTADSLSSFSDADRSKNDPMGTIFGQEIGTVNLSTLEVARERKTIFVTESSTENNLIMQFFEVNDKTLKFNKLDVIDYGEIDVDDEDDVRPNKHIFFVGKVYLNKANVPCFVNLFTVILD